VNEIPRQQLALYALAIVAIALIGARYLKQQSGSAPEAGGARHAAPIRVERPSASAFVHVTGAVRHPGVYRLPGWARLDLAVRKAGGAAPGADLEGVNLAAKVADGQQVVVPRKGAAAAAGGALGGGEAGTGAAAPPVSLNTGTPEQLDTLDGVGPATVQKILEFRSQHGGFRSVDDLKQISGIGPKRFQALKDKVRM
jgi:competence protein ComEA